MRNPAHPFVNSIGSLSVTLALALAPGGCGSDNGTSPSTTSGALQDVKSIIFLQRVARNEGVGNVFDYNGYVPGGRIVKLEPPAANGKRTVLTSDPLFDGADFQAWDLSFDATQLVFAARLKTDSHYQLFTMGVDGSNPRQISEGPYDHVYPTFLPGQKIMFMTSKVVEDGAAQFRDEYERATTAQVGVLTEDGKSETLGPRNVSHRVAPALLKDGSVIYTEWLHLGDVNDGHLRMMNGDMTGMREAFGGENRGITNSYLKARPIESYTTAGGKLSHRLVAIGTSRDRTLQAGKLLLIDLKDSEATAEVKDLTPDVPGDRIPSKLKVGRYYDAEPLGDATSMQFLVSWADGPVESEVLGKAKTNANFGLYVFDATAGKRFPIYDDPAFWDVMARPVRPRAEPAVTESPVNGSTFTLGALDVYTSSLVKIAPGAAVKVRLLEGFSSEEGFPDMFGLTEFDGQSRYGEVPVYQDGSFAAVVPANVPVHMQVIDKFAMSLASEPVWVSGRPGEQRFCGGCHEDRAKTSVIAPGSTEAMQRGAVNLDVPRAQRVSMDFSYEKIRGVPWNTVLQPIFDAKCASCHDGNPSKPGNRTYTVTDMTLGTMQTFTFDLRSQKIALTVGERRSYDFPASYISLVGLGMEFGDNRVVTSDTYKSFISPGSAKDSDVIKKVNPPQQFPAADLKTRAFPGANHPADVGGQELTALEYYQLVLNIDMGAQFYFRENKGN